MTSSARLCSVSTPPPPEGLINIGPTQQEWAMFYDKLGQIREIESSCLKSCCMAMGYHGVSWGADDVPMCRRVQRISSAQTYDVPQNSWAFVVKHFMWKVINFLEQHAELLQFSCQNWEVKSLVAFNSIAAELDLVWEFWYWSSETRSPHNLWVNGKKEMVDVCCAPNCLQSKSRWSYDNLRYV